MQADEHDVPLASVGGVRAHLLRDRADLADALAVLDRAEAAAGAPLVDQAERRRLEAAVADDRELHEHHHAVLAHRGDDCVGYAGLVVPVGEAHGVGDVAFPRGPGCHDVLRVLLEAVDTVVRDHEAHGTELWIRHATPDDVLAAIATGYAVRRRLSVLGRSLGDVADTDPVRDGVRVRPATPADAQGVTDVLAAAYEGTPDEGWTTDSLAEHTQQSWFRWEDVLLAEPTDGGDPVGVHWTKRRGDGVGEVYNLAVAPSGQGRGLGRRLLDAGLAHLRTVGCEEVVLWVDLANEAAVRLYTTAGFTSRWEDVAFIRHARGVGRHDHVDGALGHRRGL